MRHRSSYVDRVSSRADTFLVDGAPAPRWQTKASASAARRRSSRCKTTPPSSATRWGKQRATRRSLTTSAGRSLRAPHAAAVARSSAPRTLACCLSASPRSPGLPRGRPPPGTLASLTSLRPPSRPLLPPPPPHPRPPAWLPQLPSAQVLPCYSRVPPPNLAEEELRSWTRHLEPHTVILLPRRRLPQRAAAPAPFGAQEDACLWIRGSHRAQEGRRPDLRHRRGR